MRKVAARRLTMTDWWRTILLFLLSPIEEEKDWVGERFRRRKCSRLGPMNPPAPDGGADLGTRSGGFPPRRDQGSVGSWAGASVCQSDFGSGWSRDNDSTVQRL